MNLILRLKYMVKDLVKRGIFMLRPRQSAQVRAQQASAIAASDFVIPYIEMRVTTRCNMRCKKCAHLTPRYGSRAKDMTLDEFKPHFDNLVNAVTYIRSFSLVGGEAMLSPHLLDILGYVMASDKIGAITIVSNAKVLPPEPLLRFISGTRVKLDFSVYPQTKHNHEAIKVLCREHNVKCQFYDWGGGRQIWFDYGDVEERHHSERQLDYMASHCLLGISKQYLNGALYLCPRISNAVDLGLIELPDDETLLITDDIEQSRRNLLKFFSLSHSAGCRYCGANRSRPIAAAEQ